MKFHLVPQNNNLRDVVPQQRTRTSYLSTCKTIANRYTLFKFTKKRVLFFRQNYLRPRYVQARASSYSKSFGEVLR